MRIGLQLLFGYILIAILSCYLVFTVFLKEVKPTVRRVTEGMLNDTSALLANIVSKELKTLGDISNTPFGQAFKNIDHMPMQASIDGIIKTTMLYRVYITDSKGIVIFDSANLDEGEDFSRWNDVYLTLQGKYGARTSKNDPNDPMSTVMYVASPIYMNNKIVGVLTVSKPNLSMSMIINKGQRRILIGGAILIFVAMLIGIFVIFWVNRSVKVLITYAKQVTNHENTTLPRFISRELKLIASSFEEMRLKLDGKDYIEKYVHTLAHELKSQLSSIRAATEILQDSNDKLLQDQVNIRKINETQTRFLANIDQQTERMTSLIERMLQLARLESRVGLNFQSINMRVLVEQVIESKIIEAQLLGIDLVISHSDEINVTGDKFLLTQALSNVISNALDFTPKGGNIVLSTSINEDFYIIEIKDTGTGIPDYAINRIYERFYSLPRLNKRKSSGLGLSFVKEVVTIHHGKILIENRNDCRGTRVLLMIKISDS